MKNLSTQLVEASLLRIRASKLITETHPLYIQMKNCRKRLGKLMDTVQSPSSKQEIYNLQDEIFACDIEIQSLSRRAHQLNKQADELTKPAYL